MTKLPEAALKVILNESIVIHPDRDMIRAMARELLDCRKRVAYLETNVGSEAETRQALEDRGLTVLEMRIAEWQQKIPFFAKRDLGSLLRALGEEVGELGHAAMATTIGISSEGLYKEAADIAIVLAGHLAHSGESLAVWMEKKMTRNEAKVDLIIQKQAARQRDVE